MAGGPNDGKGGSHAKPGGPSIGQIILPLEFMLVRGQRRAARFDELFTDEPGLPAAYARSPSTPRSSIAGDRAHRIGFALIPALLGGLATVALCAVTGTGPEPWLWLAAVAAGSWGYRYARRWSAESTGTRSRPGDGRAASTRD